MIRPAEEVEVMDLNQQPAATLSLPAGAQVFASDVTLAAIVPDEQAQTVTLTLYSVEDLQNPQAVSTVTHQGELFDAYQSVSTATRWVTSVWFDREQVGGRQPFCRRSTARNFPRSDQHY